MKASRISQLRRQHSDLLHELKTLRRNHKPRKSKERDLQILVGEILKEEHKSAPLLKRAA